MAAADVVLCVVCLDDGPGAAKIPCHNCKNKFAHAECLLPWIIKTGSCPTCRTYIVAREAPQDEEHQQLPGLEMATQPYIWPWVVLMLNIIASFGIYMNLEPTPALQCTTATAFNFQPSLTVVSKSMDLFLGVTQYIVLFTGIFHMVTYYAQHNHIMSRPSVGFVCWLMFMIFVAVLSPFVYALSHTSDSVLLILAYAVLVVSAVPAIALRSHMWRLSNFTTSILFCCAAVAMRKKEDVRLVLIITLFGHYLVMATVIISRTAQEEMDNEPQPQQEETPPPAQPPQPAAGHDDLLARE